MTYPNGMRPVEPGYSRMLDEVSAAIRKFNQTQGSDAAVCDIKIEYRQPAKLEYIHVEIGEPSEAPQIPETHGHNYTSTACGHAQLGGMATGLHERCRKTCKFCGVQCDCECHSYSEEQKAFRQKVLDTFDLKETDLCVDPEGHQH